VVASYTNGQRCPSVRPSVAHKRISPKLSQIDVRLLGNWNRNPGFLIQNLLSYSRSETWFRHFGRFRVVFSDKLYRKVGTTLRTVAGQLSSRPITDDTLLHMYIVKGQFRHNERLLHSSLFRASNVKTCTPIVINLNRGNDQYRT